MNVLCDIDIFSYFGPNSFAEISQDTVKISGKKSQKQFLLVNIFLLSSSQLKPALILHFLLENLKPIMIVTLLVISAERRWKLQEDSTC